MAVPGSKDELVHAIDETYAKLAVDLGRVPFDGARIVALVTGLSDAELYGSPWYGKYTAGRMIQLNTSSPYVNARTRVRTWLRVNG